MPGKKYKAEDIVWKLRPVDVFVAQGNKVPDAIWSICVTQVTYYR
jgi:putative transposase